MRVVRTQTMAVFAKGDLNEILSKRGKTSSVFVSKRDTNAQQIIHFAPRRRRLLLSHENCAAETHTPGLEKIEIIGGVSKQRAMAKNCTSHASNKN